MLIPKVRIDLYKFISEGKWSQTPTYIDTSYQINEDEGIEVRKDTFSFSVPNNRRVSLNDYTTKLGLGDDISNQFRINDKLVIYAWRGNFPSNSRDAILIEGIITEYNSDSTPDGNSVLIRGANATEVLLSTMVPSAYLAAGSSDAPTIIGSIVERMNSMNPAKKVAAWKTNEKRRWDESSQRFIIDNTDGVFGSLQVTKANGSAFPYISYAENWKSCYQQVETLSTSQYTGDEFSGTYIFGVKPFIDPSGSVFSQIYWNNKPLTLAGSITEGINTNDSKVKKGIWNMINASITNAGQDLYGAGILKLAINISSMTKYGAKWKYIPLTSKFDRIYDNERTIGASLGSTFGSDRFPDDYDWRFQFNQRDSYGADTGQSITVSSDSLFNGSLRDEAGWQAYFEAKAIVDQLGEATFKAQFDLEVGSNNYILGDGYSVIVPSFGWDDTAVNPSKKIRLVDAKHNISKKNGWKTTLIFEEDEKTISDRLNS